ncbi:hypothetical protein GGD89_003687 [Roseospira visakhapatnamensis]|uniref:Uncharacterized protein n=1 Tax=Roseospira visakhapatnamensis TaxID=390880 RepID=A0A7W6RHL0_9PROT|nr:hypothetical protein [Roseospira visakhapatnamensis]
MVPLVVALIGSRPPWVLCLDRTNWKLGQRDVNILLLAVATRRFRVPLMWTVLQARQRRLRTQIGPAGQALQGQLEDRVAAQGASVVGVFIAGRDHQRAKGDYVGQRVLSAGGVSGIVQAGGQPSGQPAASLDLAQHQKAAVLGDGAAV